MTTEHEPHEPPAPKAPIETEAPKAPIETEAPEAPIEIEAPIETEAPEAPIETMTTTDRRSVVVVRPGWFLTLVIASVVLAGLAIYWLLRTMRI